MARKCEICNKSAAYGIETGKAIHCKEHSTSEMRDVVHKLCEFENCYIRASIGLKGKKATRCTSHKTDEMIDVINKKCSLCDKIANFALKGEKASRCSKHKSTEMINVKTKKCKYKNCTKEPSFNLKGKKRMYCYKHKTKEMINVASIKCIFQDCVKEPHFNFKGKERMYCSDHKTSKMINVRSEKCTSCGLFQVKKNNNYLCSYCNPNPSKRQKTKENEIKTLLEDNGYKFIHDKQFKNDCYLKYRPDFVFDCVTYFLVIECDEFAHKGYEQDCEIARMNNITLGLGLPTVFIRYNPDLKSVRQKVKQAKLLETLNIYLNKDLLIDPSPVYLFYT
jgi:hypothetical protein